MSEINNNILDVSPFEIGYLVGMTSKDKNIPRSLWLKLHIAMAKTYLQHPSYKEEAVKSIKRWTEELNILQTIHPIPMVEDKPLPKEPMWVTKDKRKIPISTMTDDHVLRSISLLYRQAVGKIVFDENYHSLQELLDRTKIGLVINEAKRRGLKIPIDIKYEPKTKKEVGNSSPL